ncbi:unnamed protein product [Ambrosiozyma monospora]|uniref:Unnamed protein product n=1 Tax=Ambrosiozyma monospora TaxID=43982 RepID=A0ACB5TA11_AMBMO|nr:unnamed protein product [Ambrosiozyma monospora]
MMLKRLYAVEDCEQEKEIAVQIIAIGFFFQLDDIKDAMAEYWTDKMIDVGISVKALMIVIGHDFGKYGTRLRNRCKGYLCDCEWRAGVKSWGGVKPFLISGIVNANEFFVPDEFERVMFAVKLLQQSCSRFAASTIGGSGVAGGCGDIDDDEIELAIT